MDSVPSICAAWQCRTLTNDEYNELDVNLEYAMAVYASYGNWTCWIVAWESKGLLTSGKIYQGTTQRYDPDGVPLTGSAAYNHGSMYLRPGAFASGNERMRTVFHENEHIHRRDAEEAPAMAIEQQCAG
jgi:hypothetical protein